MLLDRQGDETPIWISCIENWGTAEREGTLLPENEGTTDIIWHKGKPMSMCTWTGYFWNLWWKKLHRWYHGECKHKMSTANSSHLCFLILFEVGRKPNQITIKNIFFSKINIQIIERRFNKKAICCYGFYSWFRCPAVHQQILLTVFELCSWELRKPVLNKEETTLMDNKKNKISQDQAEKEVLSSLFV